MTTPQVREILSWYASETPGTRANLARMLNTGRLAGTGKLVILPVDQGFEHGPARSFAINPPAYDPRYHFELAIEAGLQRVCGAAGDAGGGRATMAAGEIPLILKTNNHDVLNLMSDDPLTRAVTSGDGGRAAAWLRGDRLYDLPGSDASRGACTREAPRTRRRGQGGSASRW